MNRPLLVVGIVALVAAGAFFMHPEWLSGGRSDQELKLSGNIEAHESLVSFKVSGRVSELPVIEGQSVKTGDLLARLDNDDYQQQVAVDQATAQVRRSQLALGLAGSRRQDIEAARQSLLDAEADLDQKTKDLDRFQALFEKDEVSAQTRDQAATNLTRARATRARAHQVYDALVEGTRKEELAIDQANLQQADQTLDMSRIRLGYTALRAPFDGVVLVRQAELGEVVSPGSPIVTLADLAHVWVRVYVPETDLGRVHWGQEVVVLTDTFPGKKYKGKVSFIASEAEFTPKIVQTQKERVTLVYRVKVDVENPGFELKPGMPAEASLVVGPQK